MLMTKKQATIGMRALSLRVINVNGGRINLGQALLRGAVLLIPFEVNHTVMFNLLPRGGGPPPLTFWFGIVGVWIVIAVYIAAILVTPRRQSVHDLVAKTMVQRV